MADSAATDPTLTDFDDGVPGSPTWRRAEARRLLEFTALSRDERGGFGWVGQDARLDASQPRQLWITTRMTHVLGLAAMAPDTSADPRWRDLATVGVASLLGPFADRANGGWFAAIDEDDRPADPTKMSYAHAFVVLAGATATAAGIPGGQDLLEQATEVMLRRFWQESEGACNESWNEDFTLAEPYRGANANMHTVEAFIAAADVTGDLVWRERAIRIAERVISVSREADYRLPEHFSPDWAVDLEYNRDRPTDKFRPYGATPGHWLEWSRLLLNLHEGQGGSPGWFLDAAHAHFENARTLAWAADGSAGFPYTLDWSDRPVVTERMSWVIAEGTLTADAIARVTGDETAAEDGSRWWREISEKFIDRRDGGWWMAIDPQGAVSRLTWDGKPDTYHAYQACLFPDLPVGKAAAAHLRDRLEAS